MGRSKSLVPDEAVEATSGGPVRHEMCRCGPSILTTLLAWTDSYYLDLIRALPDVCVAKFGPTFVVLHPTVPLGLVCNNHFCFTVLDAIELPKDSLHGM